MNAAAFFYDYGGLQVTRIRNNNSINDNIDAQIFGLELETVYQPEWAPGIAIDGGYSYLKAEVDGSQSLDPVNRTAGNPDYVTLKNIDPGSATGVNYIARIANGGRRRHQGADRCDHRKCVRCVRRAERSQRERGLPAGGCRHDVQRRQRVRQPDPIAIVVDKNWSATDVKSFVFDSGRVQLIVFFAFWDGTSKAMAPIVNLLAKEYGSQVNFHFLDIDNPATVDLKEALHYRSQPHFFLLDPDGEVLKQWQGFVDESELKSWIDQALGK